jgi:uncharacterized membrane protein YkvA (DUF1232 family)
MGMGLFVRLRALAGLWRQLPLAWRLMFDGRTPLRAKLLLIGVLMLIVSPINWLPNAVPVVGELDDLALLLLGVQLFLRVVPDWLRQERALRRPG